MTEHEQLRRVIQAREASGLTITGLRLVARLPRVGTPTDTFAPPTGDVTVWALSGRWADGGGYGPQLAYTTPDRGR